MGVLNDYLAYLPTVFDSSMAVAGTKKMNMPFNKADLAGIMLNLVLSIWVNQYNMTHSMLPKNPRALPECAHRCDVWLVSHHLIPWR
jgi:hypothetical protein